MNKSYKQFLLVAKLGSMSLAAEALGLSQPTLSQKYEEARVAIRCGFIYP